LISERRRRRRRRRRMPLLARKDGLKVPAIITVVWILLILTFSIIKEGGRTNFLPNENAS
jgi:hypothetical protein